MIKKMYFGIKKSDIEKSFKEEYKTQKKANGLIQHGTEEVIQRNCLFPSDLFLMVISFLLIQKNITKKFFIFIKESFLDFYLMNKTLN